MRCLPSPSDPPVWTISSLKRHRTRHEYTQNRKCRNWKFDRQNVCKTALITFSVRFLHPRVLLLQVCLEVFENLNFEVDRGVAVSKNSVVQGLHLWHEHLAGMHDHKETWIKAKACQSTATTFPKDFLVCQCCGHCHDIPKPMMALVLTSSSLCLVKYSNSSRTFSLITTCTSQMKKKKRNRAHLITYFCIYMTSIKACRLISKHALAFLKALNSLWKWKSRHY